MPKLISPKGRPLRRWLFGLLFPHEARRLARLSAFNSQWGKHPKYLETARRAHVAMLANMAPETFRYGQWFFDVKRKCLINRSTTYAVALDPIRDATTLLTAIFHAYHFGMGARLSTGDTDIDGLLFGIEYLFRPVQTLCDPANPPGEAPAFFWQLMRAQQTDKPPT